MSPDDFEKRLTAAEAAAGLAEKGIVVSPKTLNEHARTKKIPSRKPNGRRRFLLSELLAYYETKAA